MSRSSAADRRLGWLVVLCGGLLTLAVQVAAPVGVPLYDGVVVQEPYRFLHPAGDQAGSPGSFTRTTETEGVVPEIVAATTENPPQAQLFALDGAFELTAGATAVQLSITPIEPPAPPEGGSIAGNVYRFSVTDQAGNSLPAKPCEGCRSLLLRAPDGTGQATIKRYANGSWIDVPTDHAPITGGYQTNVDALGDYAVIETPEPAPGPDPILLVGGALLVALLGAGAFLLLEGPPGARPRGSADPDSLEAKATTPATAREVQLMHQIGRRLGIALASFAFLASALAGCRPADSADVIRIGAVFPISSNAASLAGPELAGVQIAADQVNADGGIGGRRIELEVRDLRSRGEADAVMADLREHGVRIVIGSYSSDLSIAASEAADRAGLLYWEAGAVADRLTGRGLPMVFRVGASGANLGANSASFAASELAGRLGKAPADLRVAITVADDEYANAVADAAELTAAARGMPVVIRRSYNLSLPDWPGVMADLAASKPDVIILASHIPDGIAFRQAMLAAGLKVGALIGSTMAECDPDFAGELGPDAIGIFASDRPTAGFQASALGSDAAAAYGRFASDWAEVAAEAGGSGDSTYDRYDESEYSIHGPDDDATAEESEEALAGFSAAWALFRHVLPAAEALDPWAVAAAARAIDLPDGSLPNGAGLRFSADPARLGQNERAAAVIWQWQAVRTYEFVWPPTYATGDVAFVPLER